LFAPLAVVLHALFEDSRDSVNYYRQLPMVQSLAPSVPALPIGLRTDRHK